MSTTFLHLSDLHIRTNWPEQTGLVTDKLFKDLEEQCAKVSNLYLVFTGDYVFEAAVQSQYAHFREVFMRRLDSLGITKDRRISVPGNHDVSREALKSVTMALGAVRSYKSEEVFLSEYDHIAPLLFASKFSNYIENESAFSAFSCCQTNIGGHGWDLGTGVGIFCLNTALCSFAGIKDPSTGEKISDKGLLSINTRLIYQWLGCDVDMIIETLM